MDLCWVSNIFVPYQRRHGTSIILCFSKVYSSPSSPFPIRTQGEATKISQNFTLSVNFTMVNLWAVYTTFYWILMNPSRIVQDHTTLSGKSTQIGDYCDETTDRESKGWGMNSKIARGLLDMNTASSYVCWPNGDVLCLSTWSSHRRDAYLWIRKTDIHI